MPVANTSINWAERLQTAESESVGFAPLEPARYNFEASDAEVRVAKTSGNAYINFRAKVADGERKNAMVFDSVFPLAKNPGIFIQFYRAVGLSDEWLRDGNPSLEQIASAFNGRKFSAEVYIDDGAKEDKNGDKYRSIKNYRPVEGEAPAAASQADQNVSQAPSTANDAWGSPQAPQAPAQGGLANPWG